MKPLGLSRLEPFLNRKIRGSRKQNWVYFFLRDSLWCWCWTTRERVSRRTNFSDFSSFDSWERRETRKWMLWHLKSAHSYTLKKCFFSKITKLKAFNSHQSTFSLIKKTFFPTCKCALLMYNKSHILQIQWTWETTPQAYVLNHLFNDIYFK